MKTKLTHDLIERVATRFNTDDLQFIEEALTKALAEYEVTEKNTALVIRDDRNDRLLKRYAACLHVDGKSKKTIEMYVRRLKVFGDFVAKPFDEVGTYDIRFYLANMKDQGVSGRTLENYRSYISAFYQWLTREDFITKNPCDKIPPIKYKEEVKRPFSDPEIDALRGACNDERQRAMVEILVSSGIRVEELSNLDITDIDFVKLSVHVKEGKGSKERVTYMTEVCAMHLKKYLFTKRDNHPALFISLTKKERLQPGGVRDILRNLGKRAAVTNVHPHRFRRTFATNLARRGMDIQTIAKLMGHADLKTTMIYVSMDENKIMGEFKKYTA